MSPIPTPVQVSQFPEYIAFAKPQVPFQKFDIVIETEISLISYCTALIHKIFELSTTQLVLFLNYQLNLMQEPLKWLSKLERLLEKNEPIFTSKVAMCKFNKLFILIDKKRTQLKSSCVKTSVINTPKRLINADSEDRYFSFYEVKNHIEKLDSFNEKILYLNEEIFEYKQADIISINNKLQRYDEQCVQFIEKLQTLRKIKAEFEIEKNEAFPTKNIFTKMQFNGNLNQLVDVFYQMHRELFVDGKPYLDGNTNDLVALIVNAFVDKDGKEISPLTVRTILKPSKEEKRPNTHKRIDIDKIL